MLTLQDTSLLFRGPGLDPLQGVHDARSGMEWTTDALIRQLRERPGPLRTIRIDEADRALAALRQAQRVALQMGLRGLPCAVNTARRKSTKQAGHYTYPQPTISTSASTLGSIFGRPGGSLLHRRRQP